MTVDHVERGKGEPAAAGALFGAHNRCRQRQRARSLGENRTGDNRGADICRSEPGDDAQTNDRHQPTFRPVPKNGGERETACNDYGGRDPIGLDGQGEVQRDPDANAHRQPKDDGVGGLRHATHRVQGGQ